MTEEEIEAGRSPAGGFTKKQLADWGVPWPPPSGWKDALLRGESTQRLGGGKTADDLLRSLALKVVEAGQGHLLNDMPDVLDFFGARMPTELEIASSQRGLRNDGGDVPWGG